MPFKLSEAYLQKKRETEAKKYVLIEGQEEEIHVSAFQDKGVTQEEYKQMRMNSYAKDDFFPKMDDELLLHTAQYYLGQCSGPQHVPTVTYNDALMFKIVPELIKRLEEKNNES